MTCEFDCVSIIGKAWIWCTVEGHVLLASASAARRLEPCIGKTVYLVKMEEQYLMKLPPKVQCHVKFVIPTSFICVQTAKWRGNMGATRTELLVHGLEAFKCNVK